MMRMAFQLSEDFIQESFLAASGPGGQNVNKVATACQIRVDIYRLGLAPYTYHKLKILAGSKINNAGELIITARNFRSREANRQEARRRAIALIDKAHHRDIVRKHTKPSKRAKAKRVDTKKNRSILKKNRAKIQY